MNPTQKQEEEVVVGKIYQIQNGTVLTKISMI